MRRVFLIGLVIALAAAVVGFGTDDYTLIPWPYGAIVWVGTPPQDAPKAVEFVTEAVRDVFEFWTVHPPVPTPGWAQPVQTSSKAWYEGMMEEIQSPSVPITEFIGRDYSLIPVPVANSDELLILPAPSWEGKNIPPLIIGFYPDREAMDAACGDYSPSGIYGPPISPRSLTLRGTSGPAASLIPILASESDIILSHTDGWEYVLDHEIAHWLTDLVCRYEGADFGSLPPLILEGIADYTACSLSRVGRRWKTIAAAWAQSGGKLESVPPPLLYDVGTSVVDYLVAQNGKEGFLRRLPAFAADWASQTAAIAPDWRTALLNVELTGGDRALYEARLERLSLCGWMIDPVLPQAAKDLIDRIYTGHGTMADIARFWQLVAAVPPRPTDEVWKMLARREDTFRGVQYQDGDHADERMARARVEVALRKYREADDWQNYYTWFVTGLREVIAAWGNQTKGG